MSIGYKIQNMSRNTTFIYHYDSYRHSKNTTDRILVEDVFGKHYLKEPNKIHAHIVNYFVDVYTSEFGVLDDELISFFDRILIGSFLLMKIKVW